MKSNATFKNLFSRFFSDYGMLLALLVLCVFFSWVTLDEQRPEGAAGGTQVAGMILKQAGPQARVLVVTRRNDEDQQFAQALIQKLKDAGAENILTAQGMPIDARRAMQSAADSGGLDVIACTAATAAWPVLDGLGEKFPALASTQIMQPKAYRWPNFLKAGNLLNVANQIVVIAIIAIGMTLVIVTGGIDLSVGSLVALSAVVAARLIRDWAGAEEASALGMTLCCMAGIALCAGMGLFSGLMVTIFSIPPFIVTLGMMLVASGTAYILAAGQSIYQVPDTFVWLGRGTVVGPVPNAVILMLILFIVAHVLMSRTALGRYIYAVGGNAEAARLSGVPVRRVLWLVYTVCGALGGLGGIITASQLKSGSPTYGLMYELYVIAAVVVGGTSLSGGQGKVFGTLIGAFIIAVIQNGMNLTGVESYTQKVVLGLVILGAVLLDMVKTQGRAIFRRG